MRLPSFSLSVRMSAALLVAGASLLASDAALADITIAKAQYAAGVTVVRGETERPFALVTLDKRYSTRANRYGEFRFRIRYLPNDCIVDIRAGRDTRPVTLNNCFLPGRGVRPLPRAAR